MDIRESRKLAYERFKHKHPQRIAELRRKASKKYYDNHKDEVKDKCKERARRKRNEELSHQLI